ncbi:MAG: hypothetical protein LQ342_008342, partial [Letrouitia transgressa]
MSPQSQSIWRFDVADKPIDIVDELPGRTNKRQQAALSCIPPGRSESAIPPSCTPLDNPGPLIPPPAPPKQDISIVKTPRLDISIGLRDTTVVKKPRTKGLGTLEASDSLKALEN